jgi:hypothetical protein
VSALQQFVAALGIKQPFALVVQVGGHKWVGGWVDVDGWVGGWLGGWLGGWVGGAGGLRAAEGSEAHCSCILHPAC